MNTANPTLQDAWLIDGVRTPIGRYGGSLKDVRTDDLAALPMIALRARHPHLDWTQLDEVLYGCANQAGEDNRNVARIAALLAGLPPQVAGATINRLCGSGLDAVGSAARALRCGEAQLVIAGGVESMTRAPFVTAKADSAFARSMVSYDTTIGWRFVNPLFEQQYGIDSMPETAENLAREYGISRAAQDAFALRSQEKALAAQQNGYFAEEIIAVSLAQKKGTPLSFSQDEHLRLSPLADLAKLKGIVSAEGTVTAGNASGVNDGAAALLLASSRACEQFGLSPQVKVLGMACSGVEPRIMGIGPVPATNKLLQQLGLRLAEMDLIELNEAFAAQALAVLQGLGLDAQDARVNPQGGAIALGHPLGMSGARLVLTAMRQLQRSGARYALCTMCIGVGQGIALVLENCRA